jgi:hypothetical protein
MRTPPYLRLNLSLPFPDLDHLIATLDSHVDKNVAKRIPSRIVLINVSLDYEVSLAFENVDV